ncbi:N(4)-acetylcytidine aminohydrolase [Klebsiella michiganensis]|nr:N(4)-acetylcytidine aminohydrolase [Klebsiella michiganensis]MCW9462831.1 N(4)-acetylcytidine aminohydrolase [Klebsiella michiganensis]
MQPNDITFFQRFQDDILAGRKTITIRDAAESHFKTGDVLRVGRYEDDGYFCTIRVVATSTVTLDTLSELHAQQENMTLAQLREVIAEIYPEEKQFYVIEFEKLK